MASSGFSEAWVCAGLARLWLWQNAQLLLDPLMPQSLLRRLVKTCTATARALLRTLATSQQSALAAPRVVDFAQETPLWPQTPATTCTATAPTSAAGLLTTSAKRRVESAEENPFD